MYESSYFLITNNIFYRSFSLCGSSLWCSPCVCWMTTWTQSNLILLFIHFGAVVISIKLPFIFGGAAGWLKIERGMETKWKSENKLRISSQDRLTYDNSIWSRVGDECAAGSCSAHVSIAKKLEYCSMASFFRFSLTLPNIHIDIIISFLPSARPCKSFGIRAEIENVSNALCM